MKTGKHSLKLWIVALCMGILTNATMFAETPGAELNTYKPTSCMLVQNKQMYQYGELNMDRAVYSQFLQRECPQAYKQYKQGNECVIAGWTLFGAGLVGAPISAAFGFVSAYGNSSSPHTDPSAASIACTSVFAFSSAMLISSVPLLSVGYHLRNKSVQTFNQQCRRTPLELTLRLTGTNIGLGLSF